MTIIRKNKKTLIILKTLKIFLIIYYLNLIPISLATNTNSNLIKFELTVDGQKNNIFSPNNNQNANFINIDLEFTNHTHNVSLDIYKEKNNKLILIKNIYFSSGVSDPYTKKWYGKNSENEIVPNGTYLAIVSTQNNAIAQKEIIIQQSPNEQEEEENNNNENQTINSSNYYTKTQIDNILKNLELKNIKTSDDITQGQNNLFFSKQKLTTFLNELYPLLDTNKTDDYLKNQSTQNNKTCNWDNISNKPLEFNQNYFNNLINEFANTDRKIQNSLTNIQNQQNNIKQTYQEIEKKVPQETTGVNIYLNKGWSEFRLPAHILTGTNFTPKLNLNNNYSVQNILKTIKGNFSYISYYDINKNKWLIYSPNHSQSNFKEFPNSENSPNYVFSIYMLNSDNLIIPVLQN